MTYSMPSHLLTVDLKGIVYYAYVHHRVNPPANDSTSCQNPGSCNIDESNLILGEVYIVLARYPTLTI